MWITTLDCTFVYTTIKTNLKNMEVLAERLRRFFEGDKTGGGASGFRGGRGGWRWGSIWRVSSHRPWSNGTDGLATPSVKMVPADTRSSRDGTSMKGTCGRSIGKASGRASTFLRAAPPANPSRWAASTGRTAIAATC